MPDVLTSPVSRDLVDEAQRIVADLERRSPRPPIDRGAGSERLTRVW